MVVPLRATPDRHGGEQSVGVNHHFDFVETRGGDLERGRWLYEHARCDHLAVVELEPREGRASAKPSTVHALPRLRGPDRPVPSRRGAFTTLRAWHADIGDPTDSSFVSRRVVQEEANPFMRSAQ